MVDNSDGESKTLPPTQKKIQDSLKQGNTIISREIYNFVIIFVAFYLIAWRGPRTLPSYLQKLSLIIEHAGSNYSSIAFMEKVIYLGLFFLLPIFFLLVVLIILANFIHHGKFNVSFNKIKIDFSNLSPAKGVKKLISKNILFETIKNIFKIGILFVFIYFVLKSGARLFPYAPEATLTSFLQNLYSLIRNLFFASVLFLLCLAALDYYYYRQIYMQKLMMSKKEMQDELKNTEGNPQIKSYIRAKRVNLGTNRMFHSVKKASVLIVSNENYAVALQYTQGKTSAPIVVAKAVNLLALQLKSVAIDYSVPIVRDKELAKILYYDVQLYEQIHEVHFAEASKAIAYAISLKS